MTRRSARQDDVWRAFARARHGQTRDRRDGKVREIRFSHQAWTPIVDTFVVSTGKTSTTYTRARALVNTSGDLRFKLYRENAFTRLGKMLGMQDIHAGHPDLDAQFIIRGNNESMIRSLLIDSRVYHPLLALRGATFELSRFRGRIGNRPARVGDLRAWVVGVTGEEQTLAHLLDLLCASLDQLSRMGAIRPEAVDYPL